MRYSRHYRVTYKYLAALQYEVFNWNAHYMLAFILMHFILNSMKSLSLNACMSININIPVNAYILRMTLTSHTISCVSIRRIAINMTTLVGIVMNTMPKSIALVMRTLFALLH